MNIPRDEAHAVIGSHAGEVTLEQLAIGLAVDLAVAVSFALLLFIVVYLSGERRMTRPLPQRFFQLVFLAVLGVNLLVSALSFFATGAAIALIYKLIVASLLFISVAGIWRVVPRHTDDYEYSLLLRTDADLKHARAERDRLAETARDLGQNVDAKVRERTLELNQIALALEKEVIERRFAEEQALEEKRRLDELILRTSTAMVFIDTEGDVLEGNHALAQVLGRGTTDELIGRQLSRLLGLKNDEALKHFVDETLRNGAYSSVIAATPPARGSIQIEASGAASVYDKRPCVMALLRDVTERKAAEMELLRGREAMKAALEVARQANSTKSDFLAKINHELRTPLNGIIGLSDVLRHRAMEGKATASDVRKLSDNIHQSGRHLLSLVDDLLDLSRLEAGNRTLAPTVVGVRSEIDAATATLASIADRKRIQIVNECDEELEWTVDQRAFKQIIINLVNNAIKFSPPGSRVYIRVTHGTEMMRLLIVDEGPGISQSDRKRILVPFGRGDAAETQKADGVGLGLTIVSELLKLQGGKLEIANSEGAGSTFTAIFPVGTPLRHDMSTKQTAS